MLLKSMTDHRPQPVPPSACAEIILVEPRQPRNIGAVIRAAANFGIQRVSLVGIPLLSPEQQAEVQVASSGAWKLVEVRYTDNLPEALATASLIIGATARPRHSDIPVVATLSQLYDRQPAAGLTALMFGRESNGLTNEEIQHCHYILTLPVSPAFPSLNLAQAVAVAASQWYSLSAQVLPTASAENISLPHETVESLITCAGATGEAAGQLRRLLQRGQATEADLALLFNLLKSQR